MNFSICLITRNESKTLPRLLESLTDYRNRGGEICIVDTGSSDNTAQIARDAGCIVEEVGDRYRHTITKELADKINERFIVDGEEPVVREGETYFDFASARNHVASLAKNDMISFADADECFTSLNIDVIDNYIKKGYTQFEYNFVFAHDQYGNEAVKFVQSKFYDRRIIKWVGIIHEMLSGPATHIFLDESILKLEHWQNEETNRSGYLRGLAVDCFNNPENDRNSHYFAREMYWCGRPKSAIKEFERHIAMNRWHAEKAQSMIFIGDTYGQLGNVEKQIEMYSKAYLTDSGRREALLNLARVYQHLNNYQGASAYAKAALEIPWNSYYANNMSHYTSDPHEILYWAKGWLGDIEGAQYHILEALRYQPENPIYLRDTQYYFDYKYPGIEGWMTFEELIWLHSTAKEMDTVLELGSWKGRSTHALATACKGKVTCVDTWKGSEDTNDATNYLGREEDVFETFKRNTKDFSNIIPVRKTGNDAALDFADNSFDMVFIDAGHRYEDVVEDIAAWLPKAKKVICGHDYQTGWPGVVQAVNEAFGQPDGVCGSIWYKFIDSDIVKKK